jgi:hypothetical protein
VTGGSLNPRPATCLTTSHGSELFVAADDRATCQQGLDVRKTSSPGRSGEVFLLDIPFYRTRPNLDLKFLADNFKHRTAYKSKRKLKVEVLICLLSLYRAFPKN